VFTGLAFGVPAALIVGRISANQISGLVYGVSTTDPMSMAGAIALLTAVAGFAAYLPAARAAKVDPMTPLRQE
jgi:ABC-type antimicrobial peptide transport system permease subunit